MYNCLKERHINVGETLVEYGEEIKNFYIIRKGFFQVEIKMKETIKNEFNDINSFGNYNDKEKTENIKYEAKNYYTNEQIFKLITYGKGEFLGDIEFYLESKKYLTKIICKSNSSLVYEISYDDFINYMTLGLKKTLIKEAKEKLEYYRKRVKDIRILKSNKINNRNK
jgi:CRP-like cAMP-binding protein